MATFVHHEPCPKCGSRDNLGRYSDGSAWCFGCKYSEGRSAFKFIPKPDDEENKVYQLPKDATTQFPPKIVEFLAKSLVTVEEAIKNKLVYSPYFDQLLYPYYNTSGELKCIQARNFNPERAAKAKYFNQGDVKDVLPIIKSNGTKYPKTLVLTEDTLSSIRIARQCDAMPVLGTYLPIQKINALKPFYEFVRVWLDRDKFLEAMHISENFKWIGVGSSVIYSEFDPKAYTDEEITGYLP